MFTIETCHVVDIVSSFTVENGAKSIDDCGDFVTTNFEVEDFFLGHFNILSF
ncbi:hypothetical protein Ab1vBOLIVR5_gp185c [Agrobacterium phage OLIVR5]|uniref:Uncharacterized protein n=1 Tax=Agrobacterium phage OLIVR5 TaxID=2723773 RepID=A0A858MTI8_9CAUD|nr:hypothetical protein KNU99_gp216 [Agrobacterium phage OLIVR5]QIW87833.1 hypothetical protein Ab1vBOLIVR5_gp185c [Agrobacterium phage OLIVR5]QIW88098.1 hypothetical protein Ab1vBOLIVR6_gp191c [Agrobacterium phage OLIVR6]